jgi:putative sterol carrier protein
MAPKPKNVNNSNEMKLSALPQEPSSSVSESQTNSSRVDHLFVNWLPKRLEEKRNLVKTIKSIYQWNLTRDGKIVSIWTLDVKNGNGSIYGGVPKDCKPDCMITIDENDAIELLEGTLDPAKAFMSGKMKVSGNLMAAHKFQQFWSEEMLNKRSISDIVAQTTATPIVSSIDPANDEAILQSIPTDGLKSDIVFNIIKARMNEEPDLVKAMKFLIQFNITKNGKIVSVWTTDTKVEGGQVYRSPPKAKPDAIVNIDDENYVKILFGKLNPQRAFMTGKVSVKGNILLLQKLDTFWNEVQGSRNDPEFPIVKELMLNQPLIPGLKSEVIVFDLIQRLVRLPNLLSDGSIVEFDITKDGRLASKWTLKFIAGQRIGVLQRANNSPKLDPNISLTIDDNDFVRLSYNTIKLEDAIARGTVKYRGDRDSVVKLSKLFTTPLIKAKL